MPLRLALALLLQAAAPDLTPVCRVDRAAMLALSPEQFDQDLQGGWRPLGAKPACRTTAAVLLRDYREAHRATLIEAQLHISYWHEGQMRASAGETGTAVPLLLAGVNPHSVGDFEDYALGTAAFLLHDRPALQSARDRLASLPQPANWAATQAQFQTKFGFAPTWPSNLNVLDGFLRCFNKPYAEAYAPPCNPGFPRPRPKPPG